MTYFRARRRNLDLLTPCSLKEALVTALPPYKLHQASHILGTAQGSTYQTVKQRMQNCFYLTNVWCAHSEVGP